MDWDAAISLIYREVQRARMKYKPMTTMHDGYALILEELDELFDCIKNNQFGAAEAGKEAVQVAAMAIRFIMDLC